MSNKTTTTPQVSISNIQHPSGLAQVTEVAVHVLGTLELAQAWLNTPALALDGQRPVDLLGNETATQSVMDLLIRIEYGVYS